MQIEYYARAQWSDRAPQMVQTLMIESFENSQRIIAVGRDVVGLRADFILKSELREFQAEYFNGARRVRSRPDRGLRRLARETGGGYFELDSTDALAPTFTLRF